MVKQWQTSTWEQQGWVLRGTCPGGRPLRGGAITAGNWQMRRCQAGWEAGKSKCRCPKQGNQNERLTAKVLKGKMWRSHRHPGIQEQAQRQLHQSQQDTDHPHGCWHQVASTKGAWGDGRVQSHMTHKEKILGKRVSEALGAELGWLRKHQEGWPGKHLAVVEGKHPERLRGQSRSPQGANRRPVWAFVGDSFFPSVMLSWKWVC